MVGINFLNYMDRWVASAASPLIQKEFHLSDTLVGLLGSAFLLVYAFAAIPFGYWADRGVRKTVVAAGLPSSQTSPALGGLTSGVGVILVSLLLGSGLSGQAVLATDALVSIALDLCKAALFQRFALLDEQTIVTGVVIGVATIPGSAIAAWLVNRMHAHLHVLFLEALILIGGISLLWNSWR